MTCALLLFLDANVICLKRPKSQKYPSFNYLPVKQMTLAGIHYTAFGKSGASY
jgi:hypothetical protein